MTLELVFKTFTQGTNRNLPAYTGQCTCSATKITFSLDWYQGKKDVFICNDAGSSSEGPSPVPGSPPENAFSLCR